MDLLQILLKLSYISHFISRVFFNLLILDSSSFIFFSSSWAAFLMRFSTILFSLAICFSDFSWVLSMVMSVVVLVMMGVCVSSSRVMMSVVICVWRAW